MKKNMMNIQRPVVNTSTATGDRIYNHFFVRKARIIKLKLQIAALAILVVGKAAEWIYEFNEDPYSKGWLSLGESGLFGWDKEYSQLKVRWDSSFPNSAFYVTLPYTLTSKDNFEAQWDINFSEIKAGTGINKPFTFQIAVGFFNVEDLASSWFLRGVVGQARNVVEWNFFPDTGYGATIWPIAISSDGTFNYNGLSDFIIMDLPTNTVIHIKMGYNPENRTISLNMSTDQGPLVLNHKVLLNESFDDFKVNAFGFISYSDEGSDGSILAMGSIYRVSLIIPDPPLTYIEITHQDGKWGVTFYGQGGWTYILERSFDLETWYQLQERFIEIPTKVILIDEQSLTDKAFYRVKAVR